MSGQELQKIVIIGTDKGLGIRIVGGKNVASSNEAEFGVFVKEVIKGSLAAKDGRLRRGDQLIEANGTKLIGVSNEKAVSTLQSCAKTNTIELLISRSTQSRDEFRRLSNSLLMQPMLDKRGPIAQHITTPVATSTPRSTEAQPEQPPTGIRASTFSDGTAATTNTRPSSASSNLTQVSTTDIETDDDIDKLLPSEMERPRGGATSSASTEVALSDVVLSMGRGYARGNRDSGGSPPPLPNSPPPMFDDEPSAQRARHRSGSSEPETAQRARTTPEGKAMSPPLSATLAPLTLTTSHSFVIAKGNGLGIVISGGTNRQDGPHIFIEKILDGMDAAKDGQLRKGDRILSVNGILFTNMTREKALTTLTQLKIRSQVKAYTIAIERPTESAQYNTGPLSTLSQPTRSVTSSIFDSDTLPVGDSKLRATDSPSSTPAIPDMYYKFPHGETDHSPSRREDHSGRHDSSKKTTPQRYISKRAEGSKYDSLHKRLSMEPSARVKLSKLEWALNYMGYIITHQQQEQIRAALDISEDGRVVFADFVNLAKELFAFKLDDAHLEANLVYALTQKDSLDLPPLPRKATSVDQLALEYSPVASQMKLAASQPQLLEPTQEYSMDQMRQKLHDIGEQRDRLKLSDTSGISELSKQREERQLQQMHVHAMSAKSPAHDPTLHQDISSVSSEEANAVLKKRVGLAEAAAKASREKANQLEDTVRRMEAELSVLREQHGDQSMHDMRTHLAAIDCELRKEKATSRRYQVATERLLQFVENCHEALVKSPDADRILYHPHGQGQSVARGDAVTGNPRPPQYLSRHAKVTATTLAQEAKETISAVQKLLQAETLPFGWDFAYTEDGQKYYVNHETKTTSWVHPVTKVNMSHGTRASTPSSQSSYRSNPP